MAEILEKISEAEISGSFDERLIKSLIGKTSDLAYGLRELHKRTQDSLRRIDEIDAQYKRKRDQTQ